MLQLRNRTPFAAKLIALPDRRGVDTLYTVVKGTFMIGDGLSLGEEQQPIAVADQPYGDPARSSIRVPSDVCLGKPGTDVLLLGSAWAPEGRPVWRMDVSLGITGVLTKTVRVFGDRVWDGAAPAMRITSVAPFVRMPLVWERAYGGRSEGRNGPASDRRNPVGVGFGASVGALPTAGSPLPNIEDPARPITGPKDAPSPVGFAPLAAHWEPRSSFAGTYDEKWQRERAPYLPDDFDDRFFQLAPPQLIAAGRLHGGEVVDIRGASERGLERFAIPALRVTVSYRLDNSTQSYDATLDAVIIESDARRVQLVWRTQCPCDKRTLRVREVAIDAQRTGA